MKPKQKYIFKLGTILLKAESVDMRFRDFVQAVKKFGKDDRYEAETEDIGEALDSILRKARKDRREVKEDADI